MHITAVGSRSAKTSRAASSAARAATLWASALVTTPSLLSPGTPTSMSQVAASGNMGEILKKVNDSNPIRIQVVENVWEAVKFLRTEPEVQTITVEGNDIVVGFHGGKDAEAMLLAKLVAHNIGICGFWREPGDLESIFMQITDHDMEKVVMTSEE